MPATTTADQDPAGTQDCQPLDASNIASWINRLTPLVRHPAHLNFNGAFNGDSEDSTDSDDDGGMHVAKFPGVAYSPPLSSGGVCFGDYVDNDDFTHSG